MPEPNPQLHGVPFMPLYHHDGRHSRRGLFAFARRDLGGGYVVLHLELAEAINRVAGPGHSRWGWAIGQGMDTLLVHVAGWKAAITSGSELVWHPDAQIAIGEQEVADDAMAAVAAEAVVARPEPT